MFFVAIMGLAIKLFRYRKFILLIRSSRWIDRDGKSYSRRWDLATEFGVIYGFNYTEWEERNNPYCKLF